MSGSDTAVDSAALSCAPMPEFACQADRQAEFDLILDTSFAPEQMLPLKAVDAMINEAFGAYLPCPPQSRSAASYSPSQVNLFNGTLAQEGTLFVGPDDLVCPDMNASYDPAHGATGESTGPVPSYPHLMTFQDGEYWGLASPGDGIALVREDFTGVETKDLTGDPLKQGGVIANITLVHETIHNYTHMEAWRSSYLHYREGFTDLFTKRLLDGAGADWPMPVNNGSSWDFNHAASVAAVIGTEPVKRMLFSGDVAGFEAALKENFRTEAAFGAYYRAVQNLAPDASPRDLLAVDEAFYTGLSDSAAERLSAVSGGHLRIEDRDGQRSLVRDDSAGSLPVDWKID